MKRYFEALARALLGQAYSELEGAEKRVIESIAVQRTVAENVNTAFSEKLTSGQRIADRVASFGGSWLFFLDEC